MVSTPGPSCLKINECGFVVHGHIPVFLYLSAGDVPQEGYSAILRLSWGALSSAAKQSPDDIKRHLGAASSGGAFQALRQVSGSQEAGMSIQALCG